MSVCRSTAVLTINVTHPVAIGHIAGRDAGVSDSDAALSVCIHRYWDVAITGLHTLLETIYESARQIVSGEAHTATNFVGYGVVIVRHYVRSILVLDSDKFSIICY